MWPVMLKALPGIVEAIVATMPDKRMASATGIVSSAALVASGHTVSAMYEALRAAQDPKSPGGAAVTQDEWRAIVARGVGVGWKAIQDQGPVAVKRVVAVYGSEETAKSAISAKVMGDVLKATERMGVEVALPGGKSA
jgi:hypothetical protein